MQHYPGCCLIVWKVGDLVGVYSALQTHHTPGLILKISHGKSYAGDSQFDVLVNGRVLLYLNHTDIEPLPCKYQLANGIIDL
jgi:hypothetical protein